jgi:hypothetical protein
MSIKNHLSLVMIHCVWSAWGAACSAEAPADSKRSTSSGLEMSSTPHTIVYYFHGTSRCRTCLTIESYAEEAVRTAFVTELENGQIQWRPVNVDEPGSRHFIQDYNLFTRSLVLVDASNPKRFKNLGEIWQLVLDKAAFLKYVQREVRMFRKS